MRGVVKNYQSSCFNDSRQGQGLIKASRQELIWTYLDQSWFNSRLSANGFY